MTDKRLSLPVNYGSNAVENVDVIDHIDIDREQVFIGEDEETWSLKRLAINMCGELCNFVLILCEPQCRRCPACWRHGRGHQQLCSAGCLSYSVNINLATQSVTTLTSPAWHVTARDTWPHAPWPPRPSSTGSGSTRGCRTCARPSTARCGGGCGRRSTATTTGSCRWRRWPGWVGRMYCDLTRPNCCQGVRDVINVDVLFECRPAINAAFHHCKSISKVNLNILILIICSTVVKFW